MEETFNAIDMEMPPFPLEEGESISIGADGSIVFDFCKHTHKDINVFVEYLKRVLHNIF